MGPSKPITITFVITDLQTGGAEQQLVRLLARLDRTKFAPSVICLSKGGRLAQGVLAADVPLYTLGMTRRRVVIPALQLLRIMRRLQPQIIQGWMYHANLAATVAKSLCCRRAHLAWSVAQAFYKDTPFKQTTRAVMRVCAWLSGLPRAIVYNSRLSAAQHEAYGYRPSRSRVIPNGFSVGDFTARNGWREQTRRELGIAPDEVAIGVIARYHPFKDHANFLRAAALTGQHHPRTRFLLAGRGVEALREVAEREGVGPRVLLLGDREDVPQLLAALDIVCCSSITEGLPNNIGEAMSAGVPCVVTDAGDTGWLVGDTGRVVPRRDPQALAGALLEMIEIGAEGRNRLGARARERIRREFSMDAHVEQMEQMFEQLVGKQ